MIKYIDNGTFARLVASSWSTAVSEASAGFVEWKSDVFNSLHSMSPEVRSAAIATLNEANCEEAHDKVINLARDKDHDVRGKVYEYLYDFVRPEDAPLLLSAIKVRDHIFLVSTALNRLCDDAGPTLDDEDTEAENKANTLKWEQILRERGYVA